jgi:hypothetical protein
MKRLALVTALAAAVMAVFSAAAYGHDGRPPKANVVFAAT